MNLFTPEVTKIPGSVFPVIPTILSTSILSCQEIEKSTCD